MHPNPAARGSKLRRKKREKRDDSNDDTDDDEDDGSDVKTTAGDSKGYNWTAIIILLMFLIPVVLAGIIQVSKL